VTSLRLLRVCIANVVFVGLIGCAPKDEIRVYEADSEPPYNVIRKPVTLLAAIVPQSDRVSWVFKVTGPEEAMADTREATLAFLKTVEFPKGKAKRGADDDGPEVLWKLPPGWTDAEGGGDFRHKTISIPTKGESLELTVSKMPPGGGRILPNVNRWRDQMNRNPISEKELPLITKKYAMAGTEATLVEVKGYKLYQPEEREPFQYTLPAGWQKANKAAFAVLSFKVEQGQKRASISVSPAGGAIDDNLNRWRKQVQLPPLDKNALLKEAKSLKIAGQDAVYVDYTSPGGKELGQDRILGAILQLDGNQLFIKMSGATDLLEREKANFERFATSLKPRPNDE
jgi:hypothetical protein